MIILFSSRLLRAAVRTRARDDLNISPDIRTTGIPLEVNLLPVRADYKRAAPLPGYQLQEISDTAAESRAVFELQRASFRGGGSDCARYLVTP